MTLVRVIACTVLGFLMMQPSFAQSIKTEYVAPNRDFKITKTCDREEACQYVFANGPGLAKRKVLIKDMVDMAVEWPAPNIASLQYGGCGTSCFNTLFVNHLGQMDIVNNLIAFAPQQQCLVYPTEKALVTRKAFSDVIIKAIPFTNARVKHMKGAALFAMTEAQVNGHGDVVIEYVTEEGKEMKYQLTQPCAVGK